MAPGRFLEIGITSPVIQESIAFYEALGFSQALTGGTWSHPYAVLTDGRLFLGLHAADFASPRLTFVLPDVRLYVDELEHTGLTAYALQLTSDAFNEMAFTAPGGVNTHLIEARTFSPPTAGIPASACGYFSEWGIPTRDYEGLIAFWERFGFVAMEPQNEPFTRLTLTSDGLNLGFYRSRTWRYPMLTFEDVDMADRLQRLRTRGFSISDDMPDALDARSNGVLIAPEGTRLFLMSSPD